MVRAPEDRSGASTAAGSRGGRESAEHDEASTHVAVIVARIVRLARIQVARARLHAQRMVFLVLGGIVLALVAAVAAWSGARLLVGGLTAGLTELLDGRVWLAELCSGLLLLAGTAAGLVAVRSWSERRILRDHLERGNDEPEN